jgi:hypothetical protein
MKFRAYQGELSSMPGLLGGSRRHGAISTDGRVQAVVFTMILAVPLACQGADEDQVMLVTTSTPEMRGGTYRVTGFRRPDCPMAG